MAWAHAQIGQIDRQQQICQEIIKRSEAEPVNPQIPAVIEARQALQTVQ